MSSSQKHESPSQESDAPLHISARVFFNQLSTQPNVEELTPEQKEQKEEMMREKLTEFQREAWGLSGVIKQHRVIDQHILAQIRISPGMKSLAGYMTDSEPDTEKGPNSPKFRDRVVLALKNGKPGFSVMGGDQSHTLSQEAIDELYTQMTGEEEFEHFSEIVEGSIADRGGKHLQGKDPVKLKPPTRSLLDEKAMNNAEESLTGQ